MSKGRRSRGNATTRSLLSSCPGNTLPSPRRSDATVRRRTRPSPTRTSQMTHRRGQGNDGVSHPLRRPHQAAGYRNDGRHRRSKTLVWERSADWNQFEKEGSELAFMPFEKMRSAFESSVVLVADGPRSRPTNENPGSRPVSGPRSNCTGDPRPQGSSAAQLRRRHPRQKRACREQTLRGQQCARTIRTGEDG